ncbi:helix-turn-helix domain-containing protein [Streptomyces acidicola]|uniref:helix-turn-helix domain-containing protein n=1 Tax=Streptomyces acidicola TaxID=2596892 RepID=UPI0037A115C4
MAWAFRQNIPKPGAKLVLLALCDFADEGWSCFPGQATLAKKTSQGERTVRRHLEWLEQEGFIVSHTRFSDGRRTSNRYTIHAPRPQAPPPSTSPDKGASASAPQTQKGGMKGGQRGGKTSTGRRTKQAARMASGQNPRGNRPDWPGNRQRTTRETTPHPRRTVTTTAGPAAARHTPTPRPPTAAAAARVHAPVAMLPRLRRSVRRTSVPAAGTVAGSRRTGLGVPAPRSSRPRAPSTDRADPHVKPSGVVDAETKSPSINNT